MIDCVPFASFPQPTFQILHYFEDPENVKRFANILSKIYVPVLFWITTILKVTVIYFNTSGSYKRKSKPLDKGPNTSKRPKKVDVSKGTK